MKIIDLLNKIANGEEVPKKIKYQNYEYEFNQIDKEYQRWFNGLSYGLGEDRRLDIILDNEVEILEEKKIPEKISINDNGTIGFPNGEWTARNMDKAFAMKINSIIDYLESKEKGE